MADQANFFKSDRIWIVLAQELTSLNTGDAGAAAQP